MSTERCVCDRGPALLLAFPHATSLLIRQPRHFNHAWAADLRCVDCIADAAAELIIEEDKA